MTTQDGHRAHGQVPAPLEHGRGRVVREIDGPAAIAPASYDLYLFLSGTQTMVAGPIPITLAAQGIYGVLATNGPDSVTATVTLIDDFQ